MKYILLFMLLISDVANACQSISNKEPPLADGLIALCYDGYYNAYNPTTKTPKYTIEYINHYEDGNVKRIDKFKIDPTIPQYSATLDDYKGSKYSRGHMTPADDFSNSRTKMDQSFYLTNMVPQVQVCNNAGVWSGIENNVREYAKDKAIYVYTGPIYTGNPTYIGNKVQVPTSMFKTIIDGDKEITYIVPNISLCGHKIDEFKSDIKLKDLIK